MYIPTPSPCHEIWIQVTEVEANYFCHCHFQQQIKNLFCYIIQNPNLISVKHRTGNISPTVYCTVHMQSDLIGLLDLLWHRESSSRQCKGWHCYRKQIHLLEYNADRRAQLLINWIIRKETKAPIVRKVGTKMHITPVLSFPASQWW